MALTLSSPRKMAEDATSLEILKIEISHTEIKVLYRWRDVSDSVVQVDHLIITGTDYTDLINTNITAPMVGRKVSGVMLNGITNKLKTMLGLTGSVGDGF